MLSRINRFGSRECAGTTSHNTPNGCLSMYTRNQCVKLLLRCSSCCCTSKARAPPQSSQPKSLSAALTCGIIVLQPAALLPSMVGWLLFVTFRHPSPRFAVLVPLIVRRPGRRLRRSPATVRPINAISSSGLRHRHAFPAPIDGLVGLLLCCFAIHQSTPSCDC